MKIIKLKGKTTKIAKVDDDDFEYLSQYSWYDNKGYAIRITSRKAGKKVIKMHREILKLRDSKIIVDHVDRNRLNNQKSNLRTCTHAENIQNSGLYRNNTSGIKGVYWHKNRGKWQVFVTRNKKIIYLGFFANKEHAIKARRAFAGQMVADDSPVQNQEQAGATGDVQA